MTLTRDIIETRLADLGLELPRPRVAMANYLPYKISGNLLYISGQGPVDADGNAVQGRITRDATPETIRGAALAACQILAQCDAALKGDWQRLESCVKLGGFVNADSDFNNHPAIINGASDVMVAVLGEAGRHTRFAVGVASLPLNWSVEIDAIFSLHP